uniref:Capsule synthesis protein n=1 Tax=Pithovirus LCDPAC01 TaxID=2506600 RepID=A0A481YQ82_9VIRU|nr:MAG: capsule synthesis protein [Pithovirus LCDPAC01]
MQPNYVDNISPSIKKFYRGLIDNGVDIVHGHSPHHVLQVEIYKEGVIMYSCGDFIDDYAINDRYRNDLGFIADITPNEVTIYPTRISNMTVNFAIGEDSEKVFHNVEVD